MIDEGMSADQNKVVRVIIAARNEFQIKTNWLSGSHEESRLPSKFRRVGAVRK